MYLGRNKKVFFSAKNDSKQMEFFNGDSWGKKFSNAKELSKFNITVNTIGPTPIDTDLIKVVPKDKVSEILNQQTIKRFGKFDDIANFIDFFINDNSSFITGQKIYLGGL